MNSAKILRKKISDPNQITTGMIITYHFWPGIIEIAMRAGMDYVVIDLEHLTFDHSLVAEACAIGRRENFPILIRPAAAEFTPLRLAMDLGPCGLLVPYIESVEDMKTIREAVYLKPRGRRRPGGRGNYWVSDFNYQTWKSEVEDDLIILPQIESIKGLENIKTIAEDPLTTAMAVGPYDLSADLGVCFDPSAPDLLDALEKIKAEATKVGKAMWMIGDGPTLVSQGYHFICMTEPIMFLEAKLGQLNTLTKQSENPLKNKSAEKIVLP
jgi:2-keto-3-deoxy-L-rhamnonate aldolase RhmA